MQIYIIYFNSASTHKIKRACNHKVTRSFVLGYILFINRGFCYLRSVMLKHPSTSSGTKLGIALGSLLFNLFEVCVLNVVACVLLSATLSTTTTSTTVCTDLSTSSVSCIVHILASSVECIVKFFHCSVDSI